MSIPMAGEAMRLLRQRMIEDMTIREIAAIRRSAAKSHEGYIHPSRNLNGGTGGLEMQ
jgi:hypothetical protein